MNAAPFLRPLVPADADGMVQLAGDRAIADTMISVPHPLDAAAARALLVRYAAAEARGTARHYAVCVPEPAGSRVVGSVALRNIDAEHAQAELSFWIGRPWWGQGLASRAAALVLAIAFGELALNRVAAYHMTRNVGSGRVLERLGFRQEGILRERVLKWGRFEDVAAYALLRSEYHARRPSTADVAVHATSAPAGVRPAPGSPPTP